MKKVFTVILSLAIMLSIAACSAEPEIVEVTREVEVEVEVVRDRYELVMYSNQLSDGRGELLDEMIAEAGFDFEIVSVQSGGGDMRDRLIAEKENPLADIVFGGSFIEMGALIDEGVLAPFEPVWADQIDPSYIGPDNYYTGYELDTVHFVYRADLVGGEGQPPVPTSWEDLATNPEWEGNYWAWGTGGTTGTVIVSSVLVEYQDEAGTLGINDEGWSFVENFYANAGESNDWGAEIASGDLLGGTIWGGGVVNLKKDGVDVDVMVPANGTPHFTANIAVVDTGNAETMARAEEFINWFGSEEVQLRWNAKVGKESVFPNINAQADADVQALAEQVAEIQPIDWGYVYSNINTWREKIALDYLSS